MKAYAIAGEIWEKASAKGHETELAEEMRAIGDEMIVGSEQRERHEHRLTEKCGAWVARVEESILVAEKMNEQGAAPRAGRAV
eukprot:1860510-Pyramimonas_sp.AAC.1